GCSILLVLGLATRLATLPLLGMLAVIQTFVYPNAWSDHLTWGSILLFLLTRGAGALSLDRLLGLEQVPPRREYAAVVRTTLPAWEGLGVPLPQSTGIAFAAALDASGRLALHAPRSSSTLRCRATSNEMEHEEVTTKRVIIDTDPGIDD